MAHDASNSQTMLVEADRVLAHSRTTRVESRELRARSRHLKARAKRFLWFHSGRGVQGGSDDLRYQVRRALAEGTLPPCDGHAFGGVNADDSLTCLICGRTIRCGEYVLEPVEPKASAHRDCYMAWHLESAGYRNDARLPG